LADRQGPVRERNSKDSGFDEQLTRLLDQELLEQVVRPGQYLGNEWGAARKPWQSAEVRLALVFPDLYELGMSNFGQRILYQILNSCPSYLADRAYAPGSDMEELLRARGLPLWGWESRRPLRDFDLLGFSLQYELTYTNVLNILDLSGMPVLSSERTNLLPLVFGGGPSAVNPEPMAMFMDFFIIGDGEQAVPAVMGQVAAFKARVESGEISADRDALLHLLARSVPGLYVPRFYQAAPGSPVPKPIFSDLPERVLRQVQPLTDANQPAGSLVPYLALVHDREVLEVRRGCDRGCRFCQPGYTFLPVRERSAEDLVRLSRQALAHSGHQEYSLLSLCVSDYTSLHEAARALNREHMVRRASMSFPSQRADRMNFDIAEELKVVRKSGITLAPEAGSERLRAVINKGLSHEQIISAITTAYRSGWSSVKLYFMLGLPTETDDDLTGIIEILKEATGLCRGIRKAEPDKFKRQIEFTCTISNFVPKPFTPFQWFGQVEPAEMRRRHRFMKARLKESGLKNVTLNFTDPEISLLEAVISRGDRKLGEVIYRAWQNGSTFDAWDEKLRIEKWQAAAQSVGQSLEALACTPRQVGSPQPWDVVHVGLADWWLVNEWKKAMATQETAPCTENTCHACGVCTELSATHLLASPRPEVVKKNPFVKELAAHTDDGDSHPSLFFMRPPELPANTTVTRIRFTLSKTGQMRFISHLDLLHLIQLAARRAGINVAHSEGFNPSPRLSLAVSLPLFQESLAEVGEVDLAEHLPADEFQRRINEQLPPEVRVLAARDIEMRAGKAAPSLSTQVGRAAYTATLVRPSGDNSFQLDAAGIKARIAEILDKPSLTVVMRDREKGEVRREIRPGIYSLRIARESPLTLEFELATGPRLHVRPQDLLGLLHPETSWRVTRIGLTTPDGIALFDLP
jgi:radical SAM family uncharacterized protein/radical SAM-linked protein